MTTLDLNTVIVGLISIATLLLAGLIIRAVLTGPGERGRGYVSSQKGPRLLWKVADMPPISLKKPVSLGREFVKEDRTVFVDLADPRLDPNTLVSRRHAQIVPFAGGHVVRDRNSLNGTFVNDRRVVGEQPLAEGSTILIGPYIFEYRTLKEDSLLGERWDDYEIIKLIGLGGMSEVYQARLIATGGPGLMRALKIPTDTYGENAMERVLRIHRERDYLERISKADGASKHVLKLQESGTFTDTAGKNSKKPYLALEFVTGGDLRERHQIARKVLPEDEIRAVGSQVARALHFAHQAGIVHCDVRPENVLFVHGAGTPLKRNCAKLVDFGISVEAETTEHNPWGDERYMAPEHITGKRLTGATDLYSLGCMLYELASSEPPFVDEVNGLPPERQADELKVCHRKATPPPLIEAAKRVKNRVTPQMQEVVMQMLEKDPAKRPPSALSVAQLLEAV